MSDPKLDARLEEITARVWSEMPCSPPDEKAGAECVELILSALREAVEAATQEQTKRIVALHAKLQGAFALLSPEDSEELGITKEMVDCEDPACSLYEEHVRHAVEAAVAQEREALRQFIESADKRLRGVSWDSVKTSAIRAWLDARSRTEEPKKA